MSITFDEPVRRDIARAFGLDDLILGYHGDVLVEYIWARRILVDYQRPQRPHIIIIGSDQWVQGLTYPYFHDDEIPGNVQLQPVFLDNWDDPVVNLLETIQEPSLVLIHGVNSGFEIDVMTPTFNRELLFWNPHPRDSPEIADLLAGLGATEEAIRSRQGS